MCYFKKNLLLTICFAGVFLIGGCGAQGDTPEVGLPSETVPVAEAQQISGEEKTLISGTFTATVRDIIPDYCLDDFTPQVAVLTEFQSYPFTVFVGEELASQLQKETTYVFTIEPTEIAYPLEVAQRMDLSALAWNGIKITGACPAEDNEVGLNSLQLTRSDALQEETVEPTKYIDWGDTSLKIKDSAHTVEEPEAVGTMIRPEEISPEIATFTLENHSTQEIPLGQEWALQVLVNGIWYDLKMVDNACFHMDLYHLESNQEYTFECNWMMYFGQELPAGKYRLLKQIGLKETTKWLGFEFEI